MSAADIPEAELSAWLDGETSPERRTAIARWLRDNPEAAARIDIWRVQSDLLRGRFQRVAAEPVPESIWPAEQKSGARALANSVLTLRDPDAPIQVGRFDRVRRRQRLRLALWAAGAFMAGGAAILVAGLSSGRLQINQAGERSALQRTLESLASRARDANRTFLRDPARPVEVSRDDLPALNGFLSRRTGLDVNAPVLDAQGTRLLGARVTPADAGPAGFIVYEDPDGERFGLLMSRTPGLEATPVQIQERRTSAAALWIARGAGFALVGPNDPARLLRLARALEAEAPAAAVNTEQQPR